MRRNKIHYEGMRVGRITVIKKVRDRKCNLDSMWLCKCDCGNDVYCLSSNLRKGISRSCGCLRNELISKRLLTHGLSNTPEYKAWSSMKQRCTNPKTKNYSFWGGKGVKICERWLNSFENFLEDMGKKPSPNHSLDRFPNINGNYEPENCRWATYSEQVRNKSDNHWIEYNGESMILQDWANRFNISQATLGQRLNRKSISEVFEFSSNPQNKGKRL